MPEFSISFTLLIIILTALVSIPAFSNRIMKEKLLFRPYSIAERGEYFRFLTHGFLHANWEHLIINMYVLYIFGMFLESRFQSIFPNNLGTLAFLLLYLSAIILSSIPSYFKHRNDPTYGALGASGATSALIFSFILFNPWEWFIFPPLPAILFGIVFLWYSNYMGKRGMDNIGHDAHFWGAVYGLFFTLGSRAYFEPNGLQNFYFELTEGFQFPNF